MLTPIGNTASESWANALAGVSGAAPIEIFDTSEHPVKFSSSVKGFDASLYMEKKEARRADPFIQYGMAGVQAIADAGLTAMPSDGDRFGVAIGSGIGGIITIEDTHSVLLESGPRRVSPFFVTSTVINMISGNLSIRYGFRGPNIAIVTACTTGTHNTRLQYPDDSIRRSRRHDRGWCGDGDLAGHAGRVLVDEGTLHPQRGPAGGEPSLGSRPRRFRAR